MDRTKNKGKASIHTIQSRGRMMVLDEPVVMGILNVTPDSFFAGSRVQEDSWLKKAEEMLQQGAAMLDIGGQSTRPGSRYLDASEETQRVIPAIAAIRHQFPDAWISIDTFHARVAEEAIQAGADIINDVSAGKLDPGMLTLAGRLQVPYIAMHMKGSPQDMTREASYQDLMQEMLAYFSERLQAAAEAGVRDIIIDPGFGFAKHVHHNFQLLRQLDILHILQKPLLVGLSRKSMIYKTLGVTQDEALNGTTVLHTLALEQGLHILRVHDVREAMQAIRLWQLYRQA